jgi:uncharacterized protein YjbI with pentapeptide repeats
VRINADELLSRYINGERNFSGVDVQGSDELTGADLSSIDLSNSCLAEMCLENINLRGANLRNAHFGISGMYCADLRDTDLSEATLLLD